MERLKTWSATLGLGFLIYGAWAVGIADATGHDLGVIADLWLYFFLATFGFATLMVLWALMDWWRRPSGRRHAGP